MKYENILFDLDGTLTDPKIGITKSVQYALAKAGIVEPDLDKLIPFIGPPLHKSFTDLYGFTEAQAWDAVHAYREYFPEKGIYENVRYEGIPELLTALRAQGRRLFVATSKPKVFADIVIRHFELTPYFEAVYGSELDGTRTDKGELISYLLEKEQLDKNATIMIGDRKHDIIGAHKNHLPAIAVGYGYGSTQELRDASPEYTFHTVSELLTGFPG
ncbi:HAD family hydrolase [Chitinophaga arvensicola]|uniref:Phosphoglycolate phosphatase n=1 Tax=Chitinophaga arvensicola TaxID=29529 RepID=A0A1I0S810_9BACT|nr:HAD family hydrolase [Chitinophaga arvensicola]SEW51973.1 phosphoglycolate phosphatase [Chitinophaga arvensicola]